MPEQPVIVSDVNETLMDREALRPLGVGPQQNDIGKDLDEIADQLIDRYNCGGGHQA